MRPARWNVIIIFGPRGRAMAKRGCTCRESNRENIIGVAVNSGRSKDEDIGGGAHRGANGLSRRVSYAHLPASIFGRV